MANTVTASAELVNGKMMFKGTAGDNPPVMTDYIPPIGDGKGYMPLELFLVSLSACLGGALSVLLRKTGKTIDALTVSAEGIRREQHPTSFEKITLRVRLRSKDITEAEVKKAVDISEASVCPVWAMIKGNVEVKTQITVEA
jgi:putative redox protein